MSGPPPLFVDSIELAESVVSIAKNAGLDEFEMRAALELLGHVIHEGETSHVQAIKRVADVIERDRARLVEMAADHRRRSGAPRSTATGAKPAEQLRWDMNQ